MRTMEYSEITRPYLLKNGMVWKDSKKDFENIDLVIKNGKIVEIGKLDNEGFKGEVIDLSGKHVLPGFFDMHVHLREPGREDKETIETGASAAFAGGFTGVACMPNTDPVCDNKEVVKFIKDRAKNLPVEVYPVGAVSKGLKGEEMSEIGDLVEGGIVAVSDDGKPVYNSGLMRRALEYTQMYNIPIIAHEEDNSLSENGVMNEGFYSTKLGLPGIPNASEDIMIMRDIELLRYIGAGRLHIAHLSTRGGLKLIKEAKDEGLNITCEVTPHHLSLSDKEIEKYDPDYKMKPPLRSSKDIDELKKGLADGIIDVIATDHAPHTYDEKEDEFDIAPFGIIGLETAFSIILKEMYFKKLMTMEKIIEKMTINPRKILNIDIPDIGKYQPAEITIADLKKEWTPLKGDFYSKSQNSPYVGQKFSGKIVGTINKNKIWTDF